MALTPTRQDRVRVRIRVERVRVERVRVEVRPTILVRALTSTLIRPHGLTLG